MANQKSTEWSNEPMIEPTPREQKLKELADKVKDVKPQIYNVTANNTKAPRVIHDFDGNKIMIHPGEGKQGILLRPNVADYLGKTGLTLTAA
jgi:hypothetical protein